MATAKSNQSKPTAQDVRDERQRADQRAMRDAPEMDLHEEQNRIGRELRGENPDDPRLKRLAELDSQFRNNWRKQQEKIYPAIYRVANERLRLGGEPSAQPGSPVGLFDIHPVGLEAGHDPTLQERYREFDAENAGWNDDAGVDNIPVGSNRVTTVPTTVGGSPAPIEAAKDETEEQ